MVSACGGVDSGQSDHMRRRGGPLILLLVPLLLFGACGRSSDSGKDVLAVVDGARITRDQFSNRFDELRVRLGLSDNGETRKQILKTMIGEQILLLEAADKGLDRDPVASQRKVDLQTHHLLDAYASRYILPDIQISETELKQLFARFNTQVEARHLWAQTFAQAQQYRERLLRGESFDDLARVAFSDPKLAENGGRLEPFTVDELDPAFENAAFELGIGEISQPVKLKHGYSVIQVLGRTAKPILTEQQYAEKRAELVEYLRSRKRPEAHRAHADSIRAQVLGLAFEPELLAQLNSALRSASRGEGPALETARTNLPPSMLNSVVVKGDGIQLTAGEILERMRETTPRELNWAVGPDELESLISGLLIRDHMLQRARAEGLDRTEEYRQAVDESFETYLIQRMRDNVIATDPIPEDSLRQFYMKNPSLFTTPPRVRLLGILVPTREEAEQVEALLGGGTSFPEVARLHSTHQPSASLGGELGLFSRSELRGEVGVVWEMGAGQWTGPAELEGGGFGFFEVAERIEAQGSEYAAVRDAVEQQYRAVLGNELLEAHIEHERSGRHVVVHEDRLLQPIRRDRGMQ